MSMGLYIRGMEMPKSCGDCPCGSVFFGYKCMAEQKEFEKYPLDSRQDWCPLVPVPPHGRLIDADVFKKSLSTLLQFPSNLVNGQWIVNTIREQPTIIEAEEDKT